MEKGKNPAKQSNTVIKLQWLAGVILAFAVIATVLITSFEIAMYADFSVYQKEYEKYDVLSELDMAMDDVMYVTHEMMAYLRGDRDTLSVMTTVEGKEQDFFNEQDRFHMGEVRDLFIGGLNIRTGSCIAAVLCLAFLLATRADIRLLSAYLPPPRPLSELPRSLISTRCSSSFIISFLTMINGYLILLKII